MIRDLPSHTLYTVLMIICLCSIALAKQVRPKRFYDFISVIGNSKYLKIYGRDQKFLDYHDGLLFINLIISLAIFCTLIFEVILNESIYGITTILKLIVGIGIFILVKVLVERLIASLFEIDTVIDDYLFQKISYKNYLGLLLLPVNALLIYSFNATIITINSVLLLLVIVNLSGLITSFKAYQNEIKNNLFYFILYLCALEIAPYVIIYVILARN